MRLSGGGGSRGLWPGTRPKKMDVELTRRGSSITREGEMDESVH